MEDSIAQPRLAATPLEMPAWKTLLSVVSAVLLAAFFLLAGVWKILEPYSAAERMKQMLVPGSLAVLFAVTLGVFEAVGGVLLIVPRFRRWGAWLTGFLLLVFMAYIGYHYKTLQGQDCSCFPSINLGVVKLDLKRAVGPEFFIGDIAMLLMAFVAGLWAHKSESIRGAAIIFGAVAVFASASFGVTYARQSGTPAPDTIMVEGKPYSLQSGRILIYFFDPECMHCYAAAKEMSKYTWKDVKVIAQPTVNPQFARGFLNDTGLKVEGIASDLAVLKKTFPFTNGPFAVAIENGRQKSALHDFDGAEPSKSLRDLGWIE
jgi:uncharacterized membrane protein YphA (DoxX/SURF4 family)